MKCFTLQIIKSKIFIIAEIESEDIASFRNLLLTVIGNVVNYVGFRQAIALSYELDSMVKINTGEVTVFGADGYVFDRPTDTVRAQCKFSKQVEGEPIEISPSVVMDLAVSRSTFELRAAIRYPDFTAMHCQLALESIRNAFCSDFAKQGWDKEAWVSMRTNLNISEDCLKSFREISTNQRHGRNQQQSWAQRQICMQIAWETLHRFVKYVNNDRGPLNKVEYPELTLTWRNDL
ncbi:MAG: hypothetical protein JJT99_10180 [Rhodobacteraceae bacterium]|nr:hypothetical protein [Paracoccaceae bacterium]